MPPKSLLSRGRRDSRAAQVQGDDTWTRSCLWSVRIWESISSWTPPLLPQHSRQSQPVIHLLDMLPTTSLLLNFFEASFNWLFILSIILKVVGYYPVSATRVTNYLSWRWWILTWSNAGRGTETSYSSSSSEILVYFDISTMNCCPFRYKASIAFLNGSFASLLRSLKALGIESLRVSSTSRTTR